MGKTRLGEYTFLKAASLAFLSCFEFYQIHTKVLSTDILQSHHPPLSRWKRVPQPVINVEEKTPLSLTPFVFHPLCAPKNQRTRIPYIAIPAVTPKKKNQRKPGSNAAAAMVVCACHPLAPCEIVRERKKILARGDGSA